MELWYGCEGLVVAEKRVGEREWSAGRGSGQAVVWLLLGGRARLLHRWEGCGGRVYKVLGVCVVRRLRSCISSTLLQVWASLLFHRS